MPEPRPLGRRSLLVLAGGTRATASTRHRLWNYRPFLEDDGAAIRWLEYQGGRISSPLTATVHRLRIAGRLVAHLGARDVVLVQKVLPPSFLVAAWKRNGARVVYDFDDALYARAVTGESDSVWVKRKAAFDRMLSQADVVVAGSPPLGDYAARIARRVEVLYPSLDRWAFEDLTTPTRRGDGTVTVGWVGNDQSQVYLRALQPVLLEVARMRPSVRLKVCSSGPPALDPELTRRLDFVPWSEASEREAARSFDVAISPLDREEWSRARGGRVSVLLCMASGVPVVASPGGGLVELVGNRGGVEFVDDPGAWRDALLRLVDDPTERSRAGAAARAVVEGSIWADVQYPSLRRLLFE